MWVCSLIRGTCELEMERSRTGKSIEDEPWLHLRHYRLLMEGGEVVAYFVDGFLASFAESRLGVSMDKS